MTCKNAIISWISLKFLLLFNFSANTSQYAHYVFNTLDQDHSGILSFEVSTSIDSNIIIDVSNKESNAILSELTQTKKKL